MLWNAPIWLNELLLKFITFIIWILILTVTVSIIALTRIAIYKIKAVFKPDTPTPQTNTIVVLACLLVSCIGLILFYYPQPVIPDDYNFASLELVFANAHPTHDRVTITDKKALDEFRSLFDGYVCRRSLMAEGGAGNYSYTVFVHSFVRDGNRSSPLHFTIRPGQMERYIGGNVDFLYVIEGDEDTLVRRVFEYAEKMIEER